MLVSLFLFSPYNMQDMVVKKLVGTAQDGIMPFALKGWEVGIVFPFLSSVFGFFGRSRFFCSLCGHSVIDCGLCSVLL